MSGDCGFPGWIRGTTDASLIEFGVKIAAPNTDTNMHRVTVTHKKSANESETGGKTNGWVATSTHLTNLLMKVGE